MKKQTSFYYGYIVVAAAFLGTFIHGGIISSYGVFFTSLEQDFGWNRAAISGAATLSFFVMGIGGLFAGRLVDRFGPRPIVAISGICFGCGLFFMSRINTLWQLYLAYGLIVAVGMGFTMIPCMTVVAQWFVQKRGIMIGIVASGIGLGMMTIPLISSNFILRHGWRSTYLLLSFCSMTGLITSAYFLRKRKPGIEIIESNISNSKNKAAISNETYGLDYFQAIKTRQFWLLGLSYFCFAFSAQTMMIHIVPHITDQGISSTVAATIISLIGIVNILGRLMAGTISDKFSCRTTLLFSLSISLISLIWLLIADTLWMFYLYAVVFAWSYGAVNTMQSPMEAELFGIKSLGSIFGSIHFILTWGSVGTIITGYIYDISKSYQIAFILNILVAIVGLILVYMIKKPFLEK